MISQELINRINELAGKKKTVGLTAEEQKEQKELYKEYLAAFRAQFKAQLDNIDIQEADGSIHPAGAKHNEYKS